MNAIQEDINNALLNLYDLTIANAPISAGECRDIAAKVASRIGNVRRVLEVARPLSEWHDDDSFVLWWAFPICEPPYVGDPTCANWPGYHTHWTPIVVPEITESAQAEREAQLAAIHS